MQLFNTALLFSLSVFYMSTEALRESWRISFCVRMHFVSLISVHDTGRMEIKVVWKCGKIYVFFTRTKFCVSNWVEKKMSEDFFFPLWNRLKMFFFTSGSTHENNCTEEMCVCFFLFFSLKNCFHRWTWKDYPGPMFHVIVFDRMPDSVTD